MASFMRMTVVPKLQWAASSLRARSMNSKLFLSTNTGPMSASPANATREVRDSASNLQNRMGDAMKQGNKEAKRVAEDVKDKASSTAEDVKDKASSTAEQVGQKTKEVANMVTEKAQDLTEKTKQTVQGAWEAAKETTQKIKDTVVGKAEDAKETVKQEAENVKRNINSKM